MRRLFAILALLPLAASALPPSAFTHIFWASQVSGPPIEALTMKFQAGEGQAIVLPLRSGYTYGFVVDYGDGGAPKTVTAYDDADRSNVYASAGTYDVSMVGTVGAWHFNNAGSKTNLLDIVQWGSPNPASLFFDGAFYGCSNLTNVPPVTLSAVTSLRSAFYSCAKLKAAPDLSALTNVTTMEGAFYACYAITSPPPGMVGMSKLSSLASAFYSCTNLVSAPDLGGLTNLATMNTSFRYCNKMTNAPDLSAAVNITTLYYAFQDCFNMRSCPDFSGATKCTDLTYAFFQCSAMTNAPSLAALTNVTTAMQTFRGCTNLVQIPQLWPANTNLTDIRLMFYGNIRMGGSAPTNLWDGTNVNLVAFPKLTPANCSMAFYNCTNLSNYGDIPGIFK